MDVHAYQKFLSVHSMALENSGVPKELWPVLYKKLVQRTQDSVFNFVEQDNGRTTYAVAAATNIAKNSDIYILDQVWTSTYTKAFEQLLQNQKLRLTCCELMNIEADEFAVPQDAEESADEVIAEKSLADMSVSLDPAFPFGHYLDLRGNGLTHFPAAHLAETIKGSQIVALNLKNNNISNLDEFVKELGPELVSSIRALYLLGNPIMKTCSEEEIIAKFPNLEIFNLHFTSKFTIFSFLYLTDKVNADEIITLDLKNRNIPAWKADVFSALKKCQFLNIKGNSKLEGNVQDAALSLSQMPCLSNLTLEADLQAPFFENHLKYPQLKKINYWPTHCAAPTFAQVTTSQIFEKLWYFVESYTLPLYSYPLFYLMDQLGLSITHSDTPNFKIAPFFYSNSQECYTLLWPIEDVAQGTLVTRDFLHGIQSPIIRCLYSLLWRPEQSLSVEQEMQLSTIEFPKLPPQDDLPKIETKLKVDADKKVYTLYTDSKTFRSSFPSQADPAVNEKQVVLVDHPDKADIVWLVHEHYKNWDKLREDQFINQYPGENAIIMKINFYKLLNSYNFPWHITGYDIHNDEISLNNFLIEYNRRVAQNLDNNWILKPFNLARSIDINISDSLPCIMKMCQTSRKAVSKYVSKPYLYKGRKVDLRFYIFVKQTRPTLQVFTYQNFRVRVANHTYSLDNFYNYEKHFTVMVYNNAKDMISVSDKEFIEEISNATNGAKTWEKDVAPRVYQAIRELFTVASEYLTSNDQKCDLKQEDLTAEHCRAIYGLDVMFDDELNPYILECNWSPDIAPFVKGNPQFCKEMFDCLFFDKNDKVVKIA